MNINLLSFKDGLWVYGSADQHALVGECAALLNWDLHPFDRWLFDSRNWNMYTRRRQDLIALRTEEQGPGTSRLALTVTADHLNPHPVVHGAVVYAMADTGMGAAFDPDLLHERLERHARTGTQGLPRSSCDGGCPCARQSPAQDPEAACGREKSPAAPG